MIENVDWFEEYFPEEIEKPILEGPSHKEREHVECSASVTERFWNCPGSIALAQKSGNANKANSAAERGTAAHEVGEICLRSGEDAFDHIGSVHNGIEIDEKICEGVNLYLETVRPYMTIEWEYKIEERVSLDLLNPPVPMAGTADFTAYNRATKTLVCIDYKNGVVPVDIRGHKPTRYYCLGAYYALPIGYDVETVVMIIVQPNALYGQAVKQETISFLDLIEWGFELIERARATQLPNATIAAGDWCKYCPAKGMCPIRAERRLSEAQLAFSDIVENPTYNVVTACATNLTVLTREQMARIYIAKDEIIKFLKDVEEALIQDWRHGEEPYGLKMVESEGTRAWDKNLTEAQIKDALKVLPLKEEDLYTKPKLVSPTQVASAFWSLKKGQKGVKKKDVEVEFAELTKDFVKRPKGQKLVPATDRRESLVVEAFEALEELPHTD